jgi:hypothetical protein
MTAPPPPIRVIRAPILTLWATVVAERFSYLPETALTLGQFVAGSSARAKARRSSISECTAPAAVKDRRRPPPACTRRDARILGEHDIRRWHDVDVAPARINASRVTRGMICAPAPTIPMRLARSTST